MRKLVASERGTAIITAIALMTVMAGVGLAAFAIADTQQKESLRQRHHEGAFNFTEAALDTQAFILSRSWPGDATTQYPTCTQAVASATYCPQPSQLVASYPGTDFTGAEWTTSVHDDAGNDCDPKQPPIDAACSSFYDEDVVIARPGWDANNNNTVWVRAHGVARNRERTLVAQVRIQETAESLPRRTVIAGKFRVNNAGNKTVVDTKSTAASPHPVTVRCDPSDAACMEFDPSKEQIRPSDAVAGPEYVGETALPADLTDRLIERARADGTYFEGCPNTLQGRVVYIANVEGCNMPPGTGNVTYNSFEEPGIVIIGRGHFESQGGLTFYGILYHLNLDNSSDFMLKLRGQNTIMGAMFVDGPGGLDAGSDKFNLNYDDRIFQDIASYGVASIVQNSWREITAD